MTVPKLCKDCRHYRAAGSANLYIALVRWPAICLRTDVVMGKGEDGRECKEERERTDVYACGPDAKHWEAP